MSYKEGTVKEGNVFVRCPHCGDSERRKYVAHLSVSIDKGVYYCFRCGVKGKLPVSEYVSLLAQYGIECPTTPLYANLSDERYLQGTNCQDGRYSLLERHTDSQGTVTVPMRDTKGTIVGYQQRTPPKHIHTTGMRGYGYVGSSLINTDYIRVVEGPYDVVYENDVCVFGSLSYGMLRGLYLYTLLLAPDSDILRQHSKLTSFVRMVDKMLVKGYTLRGIEIFDAGYDPASAYEYSMSRRIMSTKEFVAEAKGKLEKR